MTKVVKKHFLKLYLAVFIIASVSCRQENPEAPSGLDPFQYSLDHKSVTVKRAGVASAHPLASQIGAQILKQGGNAVDAGIAMQWALAVVYPEAGNIGGGGFSVIHLAGGENTAVNYREKAPGKASRDMYLDQDDEVIPRVSRDGALAVGVPGTVAGIFLTHDKYGKLPMKKLIQPAIDLAQNGYVITEKAAGVLNVHQRLLKAFNPDGNAFIKEEKWQAGDTIVQKELAHTLELIRDQGKAGFYEGETADKLVAEMKRQNGLITLEDLKKYEAEESAPLQFDYKGYEVITMPPPSSGGVLLQQMLGMLENYPVEDYGFATLKSVQLMTEIERRAFADRASYLGDPNFVDNPIEAMTDRTYLKQRMKDFDPDKAGSSEAIKAGILLHESDETTHLVAVDSEGNAVSTTYTLNGNFGSHVVVGGAGFVLNNEMDDFSAKTGAPNKSGLVLSTDANAIEPHKRMLSSMTPTMVLKEGKPFLVLGSIGSATIITSVFQSVVDIIDFEISVEDAVNKPKFHMQWLPDIVDVERNFPDSITIQLKEMGYTLREKEAIGRTEIIKIDGDTIQIVADHRGDDSAAGY